MNIQIGSIVFDNWRVVQRIGQGAFGCVYRIEKNNYGVTAVAALKVIEIPSREEEYLSVRSESPNEETAKAYFRIIAEQMIQEINIMSALKSHPNIVSIEDYQVNEKTDFFGWQILIRMEFLKPLIKFQMEGHVFNEDLTLKLALEMCNALAFCEEQSIIHRDIKPDNIMVSDSGQFKLGDFGVARNIEKTVGNLSRKGTETYMAPELYKNKPYGKQVDIYSLGMVLYRFMNGNKLPFLKAAPGKDGVITYEEREQALLRRMNGEKPPRPANASREFGDIILKAIEYDPRKRYLTARLMLDDLEELEAKRRSGKVHPPQGSGADVEEGGKKKKSMLWLAGIPALCAVIGAGAFGVKTILQDGGNDKNRFSDARIATESREERETGETQEAAAAAGGNESSSAQAATETKPAAEITEEAKPAAEVSEEAKPESEISEETKAESETINNREMEAAPEIAAEAEGNTESDAQTQTELTEPETNTQPEPITQAEAVTETEKETQTEAPTETEKETQTEAPAETEKETQTEAPTETEKETQTEAPKETEKETQAEAPKETEKETQTETPAEPQTEKSAETEKPTETEPQTEKPAEPTPEPETAAGKTGDELYEEGWAYYEDGNYGDALPLFEQAAAHENADSLNMLGYMYQYGEGVEKDTAKALEYYQQAISLDNAAAAFNLGYMYYHGDGVEQSYEEAAKYYTLSDELGESAAATALGDMYYFGLLGKVDYQKSVAYYRKAAEKDGWAMYNLAYAYQFGKGTPVNYALAREYYEKAREVLEDEEAIAGIEEQLSEIAARESLPWIRNVEGSNELARETILGTSEYTLPDEAAQKEWEDAHSMIEDVTNLVTYIQCDEANQTYWIWAIYDEKIYGVEMPFTVCESVGMYSWDDFGDLRSQGEMITMDQFAQACEDMETRREEEINQDERLKIFSDYLEGNASFTEVSAANSDVNIRSHPVDGAVIGKTVQGETLSRLFEVDDGWTLIDYEGRAAYIASDYLTEITD